MACSTRKRARPCEVKAYYCHYCLEPPEALLYLRMHVVFIILVEEAEHQSVGYVEQEWSVLTSVSSLNLRPVLCQVDVCISRQIWSRLSHVPEDRVDEHKARLESVKVRLVSKDRT